VLSILEDGNFLRQTHHIYHKRKKKDKMNFNFLNKIFSRQVNFACKTQFFLGPVEINDPHLNWYLDNPIIENIK